MSGSRLNKNTVGNNPFSTARIRPSENSHLFFDGNSLAKDQSAGWANIFNSLSRNRFRGQIVGPHGTGKSTLLRGLVARLQGIGLVTEMQCLPRRDRRSESELIEPVPVDFSEAVAHDCMQSAKQISRIRLVDGFEQFTWLNRLAWNMSSQVGRSGLIVTTHRSVGLPTIYATDGMNLARFSVLVERLLAGGPPASSESSRNPGGLPRESEAKSTSQAGTIEARIAHASEGRIRSEDVESAWRKSAGNVREALFCLYDVWEAAD